MNPPRSPFFVGEELAVVVDDERRRIVVVRLEGFLDASINKPNFCCMTGMEREGPLPISELTKV